MDLELRDSIAIVTGSSRGLGQASARALAAEGCLVALCARGEERLQAAARDVAAASGGRCSGDLAISLVTTATSFSGTSGDSSRIGVGWLLRRASSRSCWFSPGNGSLPVIISYVTSASE